MEKIIKPTPKKNRILDIDIIRGFALLGVFLVNLTVIGTPLFAVEQNVEFGGSLNGIINALINLFATGKFYTIFSILFGLGFFIFMDRTLLKESENVNKEKVLKKRFTRRMLALLVFGIMHLILVWWGDILHTYAIAGFILLLLRNKSDRTLKIIISVLLIGFILLSSIFMSIGMVVKNIDFESFNSQMDSETLSETSEMDDFFMNFEQRAQENALRAYNESSYLELVWYRSTRELPLILFQTLFSLPKILALFLIGFLIGRSRIFENLNENRKKIKKYCIISGISFFLLIFIIMISGFMISSSENLAILGLFGLILGFSFELSTLLGATFYMTLILTLLKFDFFKTVLKPLSYVGKMALTNYLLHTIIFGFMIYGYGLGLNNQLQMYHYPIMAISLFIIQIIFSYFYLSVKEFGPMEKLWRYFTYK